MNKRKSNIDDSRLQEKVSDTATDPIMPECEEDASEHQIDFVMKMPNCVVDPESREKVIRYFQQEQGGTNCWGEVKAFLETAECTVDENGNKVNPFASYGRPELGDILYKDMNDDHIIGDDDRVPMGHGNMPRFFYDINLGFGYKGFDFSMLMSGTSSYKVQYRTTTYTTSWAQGLATDIYEGRWYEGRTTPATFPRLLVNDSRNTLNSTIWQTDKAFFKIRNIQLGYTLPEQWVKAASLSRVRVFCSLENFFTFTDYVGLDPEVSGLAYPTMRQASFGLNVSF